MHFYKFLDGEFISEVNKCLKFDLFVTSLTPKVGQKGPKFVRFPNKSCFSDDEGAFFEENVKRYRFEPTYTEDEVQAMSDRTQRDNILAYPSCSTSSCDIVWCKRGCCVSNTNIDEKLCCKNPLLLPDEKSQLYHTDSRFP